MVYGYKHRTPTGCSVQIRKHVASRNGSPSFTNPIEVRLAADEDGTSRDCH